MLDPQFFVIKDPVGFPRVCLNHGAEEFRHQSHQIGGSQPPHKNPPKNVTSKVVGKIAVLFI